MIQSLYGSPSYKSPTPEESMSPKRKRRDTLQPSEALSVQTLLDRSEAPAAGPDSPRSKVAERLQHLDITPLPVEPAQTQGVPDVHPKRLKLSPRKENPPPRDEQVIPETPDQSRQTRVGLFASGRPAEIEETPQERQAPPTSPLGSKEHLTASSNPSLTAAADVSGPRAGSGSTSASPPSPKVLLSPPPPREDYAREDCATPDRALSPLQLNDDDLSPNQAALTWQDSEITGHEIAYSLGDDGVGINGIGFKPTPAIAFARSQKRKQQISEWRARESREARQKRMDRRRKAGDGEDSLEGDKRVVRFYGVG